jgi:glycosyltransferase involved in cell wall biosynthesis
MRATSTFVGEASFFWSFFLGRWRAHRKRARAFSAKQLPTVSVVVPTLNEEQNLPHVLPLIPAWVDEVVLVDGHSTDNTIEVARQLWPGICIVFEEERGKGAALRTGFKAATGDIIVMIDADGSTDPGEIPAYVSALLSGADYAKGSRFAQGGGTADMSRFRYLGNQFFIKLVRLLFGGSYSDLCYGYNAFWADVLPDLYLDCNGFEIETLMSVRVLKADLKIVEVPSFEHRRIYGESRLRAIPDGWRVLKIIMRERLKPAPRRAMQTVNETMPDPTSALPHAPNPATVEVEVQ